VRLSTNSGPGAARNFGAGLARAAVLVFIDADVVIGPGALERIRRSFAERPDMAAMFGSYDDAPRAAGYVSRYRNLLHHFTHQTGRAEAATFWGGCGAVRREAFSAVGGFDALRFPQPSIEDIEFGHRLREAGYTIVLDPRLQCTHLKQWRLLSMIRTDVTRRAVPWARLTMQTGAIPNALNLAWSQRLSAVLVATTGIALAGAWLNPSFALVGVAALAALIVVNRALYRLFFRSGGFPLAVIGAALHILYFIYSSLSYVFVWLEYHVVRQALRRRPTATVAERTHAR
jgi:cellulose synthase/poly-beta-1,6-N-acetylglucosamine synthase-like glycosyltransferase